MTDFLKLDLALFECQKAIKPILKESKNEHSGYLYVSSERMIEMCREILLTHGLLMLRKSEYQDTSEIGGVLSSLFTLVHVESGECRDFTIDWSVHARKGMPKDKALASSLTSSLSYFYRDLLQIPRFEENEMDRQNDSDYDPTKKPGEYQHKINRSARLYDPEKDHKSELQSLVNTAKTEHDFQSTEIRRALRIRSQSDTKRWSQEDYKLAVDRLKEAIDSKLHNEIYENDIENNLDDIKGDK